MASLALTKKAPVSPSSPARQAPATAPANVFGCYFNDPQFADAVVVCGEREFRVHKIILAAHSPVFKKTFSGEWKEAKEGKVVIEDEPSVVEAMLSYMYNQNYSGGNLSPVLEDQTLLFHSQVYAIADIYHISALKILALANFTERLKSKWQSEELLQAIPAVYSDTPEHDRGLRDLIAQTSCKRLSTVMGRQLFKTILRETPYFAADVAEALAWKASRAEESLFAWPCQNKCGAQWKVLNRVHLEKQAVYCPQCGGHVLGTLTNSAAPAQSTAGSRAVGMSSLFGAGTTQTSILTTSKITGYIAFGGQDEPEKPEDGDSGSLSSTVARSNRPKVKLPVHAG